MADLILSLSRVTVILVYWIFVSLMINRTLTRKYNNAKTFLCWSIGLVCIAIASIVIMYSYGLTSSEIPLDHIDVSGFIHNLLIISSVIIATIVVSLFTYKESRSSIFFVSSFFALIGLIFSDLVTNAAKLTLPVDAYFTPIYFVYQTVFFVGIMIIMLIITYIWISGAMKNLFESLKGNLQDFIFAAVICTVVYIFMSTYFNMQTSNIITSSQIVPRVIFLILCITMYFVIIYGVKRTIKNIQIEDDLRLAKDVQASILPDASKFDEIKGLKVAAKMIPYSEIGGDFYDVFKLDEDNTAFLITDVAGKGIPAAMFMMRTKSFLKINMLYQKNVAKSLTFANRELLKNNDLCMFYTAVAGVFNSKTSTFSYSCGGHYPPVLIRDGKAVSCESTHEPVIGVKEHEYREFKISLKKDDMIFLYTDGLTDTLSRSGERYGSERFMNLIAKETEPDKIVSDLIADINKFCWYGDYADDLTLLVFKVL
ncbi:MAG: PP2C family protein-serine/threonine phosphatase [Methanocorpusculum sp.]|nr:PP2C family protein-serine/threonine phosphatase [Methanocorpusculum sp.]